MARWTGKLVGGFLGLLALGPIGAAAGALLGHQFDKDESEPLSGADAYTVGEQFFRSTFAVMGHVAKSDGHVSEREITAARGIMTELRLDAARVQAAIACFTAGKQAGFDLTAELARLAQVCVGRPDLKRIFFEIQMRAALAGNDLQEPARTLLYRIAGKLGIPMIEFVQIEAMLRFRGGTHHTRGPAPQDGAQLAQAYRVLEVEADASDESVVKAYRRQLSRHHPDKLKANGLPESMLEHAKEQTQRIIEAYELIRERRGMR